MIPVGKFVILCAILFCGQGMQSLSSLQFFLYRGGGGGIAESLTLKKIYSKFGKKF
jgi:hypothetical protein